ncbi:MEDS domain-containing protein [Streptomyces sp. NPDC090306]|uniref:MEDS domain-containing protein n=1 Tax=Streptomyces sp. NPDC090306 TaxID=3365961 RepID=UPI00380BED95
MGRARPAEDARQGDHLCLAFADDLEQRRVMTAYLRAGLERGERVIYYADRNTPETVLSWLRAAGVDPTPALRSGQLGVTTADDSYLAAGPFDPDAMVAALHKEVADALAAGYRGYRVSGEMGWATRGVPGAERLGEYETKVDEVFAGRPASAICQYDARRFAPAELDAFERRHPATVELTPLYDDAVLRLVPYFRSGRRAVRVAGTVDHRTTQALAAALEAVRGWSGDVWLDMGDLEFIDLAGLRALVAAAERLPDGRRLHIVELAPLLSRVVSVVGWDTSPSLTVRAREGRA